MMLGKAITVIDLENPAAAPVQFGGDETAAARYAASTPRRTLTNMVWEDGTIWHGVSDPVNGTMTWVLPQDDLDELFKEAQTE